MESFIGKWMHPEPMLSAANQTHKLKYRMVFLTLQTQTISKEQNQRSLVGSKEIALSCRRRDQRNGEKGTGEEDRK